MQDFLSFQTFIAPSLLIVMYYIGALLIPLLTWYGSRWIKNKYLSSLSQNIGHTIQTYTNTKQRFIVYLSIFFCFICMEILWRVMFEFLIAYFDIHDILIQLKDTQ